jgi:hypothetical protein
MTWGKIWVSILTVGIRLISSTLCRLLLSSRRCNPVTLYSIVVPTSIPSWGLSDMILSTSKSSQEVKLENNQLVPAGSVEWWNISILINLNLRHTTVLNSITAQLTPGSRVSADRSALFTSGATGKYFGCLTRSPFSALKRSMMRMTWMHPYSMMTRFKAIMRRSQKHQLLFPRKQLVNSSASSDKVTIQD